MPDYALSTETVAHYLRPTPDTGGSLTPRERYQRVTHFHKPDHVFHEEFGYWNGTLLRWHEEGLPKEIDDNFKADCYFGFDRKEGVPLHLGLLPGFEEQVVEEDERHVVKIDGAGVKCVVMKDGSHTIPHYLEFPIKGRADWERFKQRLNPHTPGRFPDEASWQTLTQYWEDRDYPLGVGVGSLFGWMRDWMGFEAATTLFLDDPRLVADIMDHIVRLVLQVIDRAVREVQLDFASVWEDMAFKTGPMISPNMFREFMTPRYKQITDFLKQHGVDVAIVDCDGNINGLVEHWLDGGVNGMFPLEINSESDPLVLRERFGNRVLLFGGVDKRALIAGPEAIREELERLRPCVEMRGYIPHVDHRVPQDVSYRNYLYYLDAKCDMFGIPSRKPYTLDRVPL